MLRREWRAVAFQALLMSAALYSCASTSNDPMNGGGAGSGGHTSLAGSGGANQVGGGTNQAGGGTNQTGGGTNQAGGGTNNAGAASAMAGSSGQGVGCSGTKPSCTTMTFGSCSDVVTPADCVNGAWQCPSGSFPTSQCQCFGAPMVCHPGKAGGACTAEWVNASCNGGTWTCPVGTVNAGACLCVLSGAEAMAGAGGEAGAACP